MTKKAIQDYYPDKWSHCYNCGRLNEKGQHFKSYWDEETEETYTTYHPKPYHKAVPGYVYGGLIASLIDCFGTSTATAAAYQAANRKMGDSLKPLGFVTASIHVDYLKPTPLGPPINLHGKIKNIQGRKAVVEITLSVEGDITAQGEVIAVQVPDHWSPIDGEKKCNY